LIKPCLIKLQHPVVEKSCSYYS